MLPRALKLSALFAVALVVTLAPKLAFDRAREDDVARLNRDVVARLQSQGFATKMIDKDTTPGVLATRGACQLYIWDGSIGDQRSAAFAYEASAPIVFEQGGRWSSTSPGFGQHMMRLATLKLAAFDIFVPRPAALAVGRRPSCEGLAIDLKDISIWPEGAR